MQSSSVLFGCNITEKMVGEANNLYSIREENEKEAVGCARLGSTGLSMGPKGKTDRLIGLVTESSQLMHPHSSVYAQRVSKRFSIARFFGASSISLLGSFLIYLYTSIYLHAS